MASESPSNRNNVAIILVGPAGSGKSSTGNNILGEKKFKVAPGTVAGTTLVQSDYAYKGDTYVYVVDTPGITKTIPIEKICSDVMKELKDIDKSWLVVFAIVIKVGRYTEDEKKIIERLFDVSKKDKKFLVNPLIIFTNRGELIDEEDPFNQTVDGWLAKNPTLKAIMSKHRMAYIAFENKNLSPGENDRQVHDLLTTVQKHSNEATSICPVSSQTISVTKDQLAFAFGKSGETFFEEQSKTNKQDNSSWHFFKQ